MLRALRKFITDRRGNVAMITALTIMPVSILVGASVDLSRMRVERTRLQSAVDAAVLAAANMPGTTSDANVEAAVNNFIATNFSGTSTIFNTDVQRTGVGVEVTSYADVTLTFAALLGQQTRRIAAHAVAERGGANLEIAMVLDITASMNSPSSKISDLRDAARGLVQSLINNGSDDVNVRMALIPYSNSVSLTATQANSVRGSINTTTKSITGSTAWAVSNTARTITGATRANPVVITTSANHGYTNGQHIYITGVNGMTELNGRVFSVKTTNDARKFELWDLAGNRVNGSSYRSYTSSGSSTRCAVTACQAQLTSNGHGYQNGDTIYVTGLGGALGTALNNQAWTITGRANNTYILAGSVAAANFSSNGTSYCAWAGCRYFAFTNVSGDQAVFQSTDCVSERTGAQAYTDAAPGSAPLGRAYGPSSTYCPTSRVTMLTSNGNTLTSEINNLRTSGSTAGQIGIAWGWYALAPNFNATLGNDAVRYDDPETRKIAVIMTDGAFNTSYCNGVVSGDSSWDPKYRMNVVPDSERINCNATNGDGFAQARKLCTAMKAVGITIYTVAFDVAKDSDEARFMADCSSGADYAKVASASGNGLQTAFAEIGDSIGRLRLTR